ncbi:uncharacterized protein LOC114307215 [Camellia sinensis]|uniref:uncharacterized protein LOC114307215 n=1 Tax=Camellia sinensis TaxID=4442 RepID=UPI001035B285|nr:uncharacterized protein LOC114307215 [Camellia sinensis]
MFHFCCVHCVDKSWKQWSVCYLTVLGRRPYGLNLRFDQGLVSNVAQWTTNWVRTEAFADSGRAFLSEVAMIGWFIWNARNDYVFNHSPVDPRDTLRKIANAWVEQQNQLSVDDGLTTAPATLSEEGKCTTNATAAIATILRDSEGRLLDGQVSSFLSSSAQQAEALAVRLACFLAQNHNLPYVEIENDNQTIIKLCVSETVPPWESMVVVSDIRWLARSTNWVFSWIWRSKNKVAHWVSRAHASKILPNSMVAFPPSPLAAILSSDVNPLM